MGGLWITDSDYVDFSDAQGLLGEIATRDAAGLASLAAGWLGVLPDPDPVLRKSGDDARVLEALSADYKVTASMQSRKLKTLLRGDYGFTPGAMPGQEPTTGAKAMTDALARDLERVDIYNTIAQVLEAPYFGFTPVEILWRADGGRLRIADLVPRPRDWFGFGDKGELLFVGERGIPEAVPRHKFILARHFPTYANPYGLRLLSRCLWPVTFKRAGIEFLMRFAERFGQPWVVGEARPGAQRPERQEMLSGLRSMVREAVAVVSGGSKVQIVESSGKGELQSKIVTMWDEAIAIMLEGQTLTSQVGEHGSYAAANTHYQVSQDFADADKVLVRTFFNDLAWAYGQVNASGELTPVWDYVDPDDLRARADLGAKLHGQGVRFTRAYFERRFSLAADEFTITAAPAEGESGAVEPGFAEPEPAQAKLAAPSRLSPGQSRVEALVAEVLPAGISAVGGMVEAILKIVAKAETPEDLQLLLAEAMPELDASGLEGMLEAALYAADMTGRFTVRQGEE